MSRDFVMNTSKSAQDVLRCHLCETPVPPLSCEVCGIYLCKGCVADHFLDESSEHNVVSIKQTLSALQYPKCLQHSSKKCELYCEQCTIPMCVQCVSSKQHMVHRFVDLLKFVEGKKEVSQNDLKELESLILSQFKEFASDIDHQKEYLNKNLEKLKTAIDEHGKKMQSRISAVVEKFKSEIVKKHEEKFTAMTKTEKEIASTIHDIEKCIVNAQELQASRDLGHVLEYTSRNKEFMFEPAKHSGTLPTFVANEIENDELYKLFGSLSMASHRNKSIEQDVKPKSTKAKSCTTDKTRTDKDKRKKQRMQNKQVHVHAYIKYMLNIKCVFITCILSHIYPHQPLNIFFSYSIFNIFSSHNVK